MLCMQLLSKFPSSEISRWSHQPLSGMTLQSRKPTLLWPYETFCDFSLHLLSVFFGKWKQVCQRLVSIATKARVPWSCWTFMVVAQLGFITPISRHIKDTSWQSSGHPKLIPAPGEGSFYLATSPPKMWRWSSNHCSYTGSRTSQSLV